MNVRVDLSTPIYDGMEVKFKAPCDAAEVTGLNLYYQKDGVQEYQHFAFADANANNVGHLEALFAAGAVVKVILDLETNMAFIQNADTNSYLEKRFEEIGGAGGGGGGETSVTEVYNAKFDFFSNQLTEGNYVEMTHAFGEGKTVILSTINPVGNQSSFYCTYHDTGYESEDHLEFVGNEYGSYVTLNLYSDGRITRTETAIGDIETALDSIIAIQNSLIGGDGA